MITNFYSNERHFPYIFNIFENLLTNFTNSSFHQAIGIFSSRDDDASARYVFFFIEPSQMFEILRQ